MDKNYLLNHWFADIYEQQETDTDEAEFVLSLIKETCADVKTILDVCCGGGRNTIPIANAGYAVTGFDMDEFMLEKLRKRIEREKIGNISWSKSDAVKQDWGKDFDVVVMAGNILINIESGLDYKLAQKLFIKKAADCVKPGGYLYLDFDCSIYCHVKDDPETFKERTIFEGTDDIGIYGKFIMMCDDYSGEQSMQRRRYEITPKDGETFSYIKSSQSKHFPDFAQVKEWLDKYGWKIIKLYGSRNKERFDEKTIGNRAVIWARKLI